MKHWRRKVSFIVAAAAILLAIAGCGKNSGASSKSLADKQELTYANTAEAVGVSPLDTNDTGSTNVISQVYETLFKLDSDTMKITPVLAKSYKTEDNKTWVIKLRKGVKFQDGTEFNSDAVKYTFDQLVSPKRAAPRASLLAAVDKVSTKGKYTVVIKTKYPSGTLIRDLCHSNASIVSPTADKKGKNYLNKHAVGTGPFKFKSWTRGDKIVLVRNNNYWGKKAKLTKVTFKTVPDYSTAVSELQTGKINFLDWLPVDYLSRIESLKNVKTTFKKGTRVNYFGFNTAKKPFNNLKFRKAVAYAINSKSFVKSSSSKLYYYNSSIIGPKVYGYDKKMQNATYKYNLNKAKEIVKANKFGKTEFSITVSNQPDFVKMAQVIQSQLKKAGFNVKINKTESASFIESTTNGDYQTMISSWANSTDDATELLVPQLTSTYIGSSNRTRFSNKTFDKYADASANTLDDAKRKESILKATQLAEQKAPWVVIAHNNISAATTDNVHDIDVDATGLWHLNNTYITK
ncbi:ABC transporter substrate-binding protein [Lactiplantibacillus plantarum]|uniref:ABC transporter substrate-binding protein n=1 Tax=Lactiplantibacillus plantarum TaxID=1590 RepID=UPI000F01334B|nr:ABC transporter substrate-binding protein [Lactiplantibacillus plantarum]